MLRNFLAKQPVSTAVRTASARTRFPTISWQLAAPPHYQSPTMQQLPSIHILTLGMCQTQPPSRALVVGEMAAAHMQFVISTITTQPGLTQLHPSTASGAMSSRVTSTQRVSLRRTTLLASMHRVRGNLRVLLFTQVQTSSNFLCHIRA